MLSQQDALAELDTAFIKENQDFVNTYKDMNLNDIESLNAMLKGIDLLLKTYSKPNDKIKNTIEIIFKQILSRYPLLFGYWKKFTAIEYQFHGLETSLKTLENATEAFPYSVDLWCDYLKVLITNYPKETELIQDKINIAKKLIGWQFYSHPFWDLTLDYYSKNGLDVMKLYYEIISIPLHQYAKYITSFKKLLSAKKLDTEIKKVDSLGKQNQVLVSQIWRYESAIKQNYFNLTTLPTTEITNWLNYVQYLRQSHPDKLQLIESVFERSLIPCCYVEDIWVKYLTWKESLSKTTDLKNLNNIIVLYERGCRIIPETEHDFRYHFLQFLEKNYNLHEQSGKTLTMNAFSKCVKNIITICPYRADQIKAMKCYLKMLKKSQFFSSIEMSSKDILSKQTAYSKYLETSINNYISKKVDYSIILEDLLNDRNLAVAVVELITTTWLILKSTLQTRKYFNQFSKHPALRESTEFWQLYYEFEKSTKNFVRLNSFINGLGTDILLPTSFINDILNDYKSFYLLNSNISEYQASKGGPLTAHLPETSTALDPILDIGFKINNPRWNKAVSTARKVNKVDWYKSTHYKENGHPGIVSDRPQITNTIIEGSSKSFRNVLPGLPTFRNLEKINQSGNARDYYSEEVLNAKP